MRLENSAECFRCGEQFLSPEAAVKLAAELPVAAALRAETVEYERRLAVCGTCKYLRTGILCAPLRVFRSV